MVNTDTAVATKIDNFKSLAKEFSVTEKTARAIDSNLAEVVKSLLSEKLAKDKLAEV